MKMIQFLVESNLFPEPLIGEYDHVEDKTRTKGNRGEGDLHISRSLSPWVVEPGQWENVGKYGLEETESFRENFNPQSPAPKKEVKNEGRTKSLWSAHRVLCKLHCWQIWAAGKRFLELALSSSLPQLEMHIELLPLIDLKIILVTFFWSSL